MEDPEAMDVLYAREEKHYRNTLNPYYFKSTVIENWRKPWLKYFFASSGMYQDDRSIGEYAAFYLDRVTSVNNINTPGEYEKLALSVSHLSLKLHGNYDTQSYESTVKNKSISTKDMQNNESKVLQAMAWNMHPPVPSFFVKEYLNNVEDSTDLRVFTDITKKLCETVILAVQTTKFKPSTIAITGMIMTEKLVDLPPHIHTIIKRLEANTEIFEEVYNIMLSAIETENMKDFVSQCHDFHYGF